MFTTLIAISTMALAPLSDLKCPVMGGPAILHTNTVEYAGSTFGFCCPGCETRFAQNPDRHIQAQARRGSVVGVHLFDPISGRRLKPEKAEYSQDHQGIRYLFSSKENLDAFNKDKDKYTTTPRRESLECPVMRKSVTHISLAGGYVDHRGVRYYVCCPGCLKPLAENPAQHLERPVRTRATAAVTGKPILEESALLAALTPVLSGAKSDKGTCDCTRCSCECGCDIRPCTCKGQDCGCSCGCEAKPACKCKAHKCSTGSCTATSCKSGCASPAATPFACEACKGECASKNACKKDARPGGACC